MKAVRYDGFGDVDVLRVVDVPRPVPTADQLLVEVRAAAVNPGEGTLRKGTLANKYPSTFPSGQGTDFAGVVVEVGPGVTGFALGDEVLGYTHQRASHAELVVAEANHIVPKPAALTWEEAGSIYVAGTAAYASVQAVGLTPGDTVVVSGAAGGVGSIATQLALHVGATVIGLAGEANHAWLADHGAIPVAYGEGSTERVRAAANGAVDAFIDTFGGGYVEQALALGVQVERINTIIDFAAAARYGVRCAGNESASSVEVLTELNRLVEKGVVEIPIAAVYPLDQVRQAFREVERRHTRGKIVLRP